jgi:hypothetical protein
LSELTLLLLRIGFLILMWSFVFAIVYALRSDLFGTKVRRLPATASAPAPMAAAAVAPAAAVNGAGAGPARRLVITSGAKEGLELPLESDQLTIGRSADSGLVIRDDYTSTNGTLLNGKKVGAPTAVPLNTPISIGTTTFELRR